MFFLVKLAKSGQKVVVPMKWVQNLDLAKLLNVGVTYFKKKKKNIKVVYISDDIYDEPDFTLNILDSMENQKPALYKAFIVKCFRKYFLFEYKPKILIECGYLTRYVRYFFRYVR